ncbi:hypothetical protein ACN38_g8319 [Penicillium nordicum]|uniref:Uncharacterized protein n=1 Tax=Penicillium nordicum TaxID=229535 RepID=A0A0M8NWK6_9EURO|nr:hypothetical protein ACN38_g8319 [Penicillium nordicum]
MHGVGGGGLGTITTQVQFRFNSGSIQVQFRFNSDSIQIQFRFSSGSVRRSQKWLPSARQGGAQVDIAPINGLGTRHGQREAPVDVYG